MKFSQNEAAAFAPQGPIQAERRRVSRFIVICRGLHGIQKRAKSLKTLIQA
ncbi:hypothetical protein ACFP4H_07335 [Pseudophaeobacter arcticus]|uniref:hypothetical protein n=1 Tax=Pseudophaeobacter arcticus TaxID=385492 RepID=UPI0012B570E1|nr:hypothetical protein [Pseudophaeobacter arcticus]